MAETTGADPRLGQQLVLDEIFDLSLYRALRDVAAGRLRAMLDELILVGRGTSPSGRSWDPRGRVQA
jgi:hypothetical protein